MTAKQHVVPVLPILFVLLVVYVTYIAATSDRDARRNDAIQAKEDADWHRTNDAQWALVKSLSTPKPFQARCGKASSIIRGLGAEEDIDRSVIHGGTTTLIYKLPPAEEMHVIFTHDKDLPTVFRAHVHENIYPLIPYDGLVEMGCVKK